MAIDCQSQQENELKMFALDLKWHVVLMCNDFTHYVESKNIFIFSFQIGIFLIQDADSLYRFKSVALLVAKYSSRYYT